MKVIWFLVGYGVATWWAHRDHVDRGLEAAEDYANYDRDVTL